jgi:hypothetical protein
VAAAPPLEDDLNRLLVVTALLLGPAVAMAELHALVVEGLAGDPVYDEQFERQGRDIAAALATQAGDGNARLLRGADASREAVLDRLSELQDELRESDQFVLVLLGHGSYDDYEYKFNLPGPDLTGEDIVAALDALPAGTQVLINTSSASGAIAELAQADDRIVVLATRSGVERHATRFGNFFAAALTDAAADTDKNSRISVAEAFRYTERQVADYYDRSGQLATEHPVIGGEPADRVSLARLGGAPPAVVDTALAELVAERDALNAEIEELRLAREDMPASDYQSALLEKMLELARVEDAIEARQEELGGRE